MTKVFKIIGRIVGISIEWLLIALILFAFAIRTSAVQTFLAQKATAFLSSELGTTFHVEAVSIVFIDRIALDGITVLDQQQAERRKNQKSRSTYSWTLFKSQTSISNTMISGKGILRLAWITTISHSKTYRSPLTTSVQLMTLSPLTSHIFLRMNAVDSS